MYACFFNSLYVNGTPIKDVNTSKILLVACSNAPQEMKCLDDFALLLNDISYDELIIAGDMNASHESWAPDKYTNRNGKKLKEWLDLYPDLEVLVPKEPSGKVHHLDIFIVSSGIFPILDYTGLLNTIDDYDSDHKPVELNISFRTFDKNSPKMVKLYNKTNTDLFQKTFNDKLNADFLSDTYNCSTQDIEDAVMHFNRVFEEAEKVSVPVKRIKPNFMSDLPVSIMTMIKFKNKTLARIRRENKKRWPCLSFINFSKQSIKQVNIMIKNAITVFENNKWEDMLKSIRPNSQAFKTIKSLAGANKFKPLPNLKYNGKIVTKTAEKINAIAEIYEKTFNSIKHDTNSEVEREISCFRNLEHSPLLFFDQEHPAKGCGNNTLNDNKETSQLYDQFLDPDEFSVLIRSLNNKKSSGPDGICNYLIKKLPNSAIVYITKLFNHIYNLTYFPKIWKLAKVCPVPKPGLDPENPSSYRPISLLSNVGKLFEKFLLIKIDDTIENKNLYQDCQFGFRSQHSTCHTLAVLQNFITKNLNKKLSNVLVSLDFSKAFDSVWQQAIIYKMKSNFDVHLCRVVLNYLEGRNYSVYSEDEYSNKKPITTGVPQGSILGPVLFNLMLSDIPKLIDENNMIQMVYADDILIAASTANIGKLNNLMNDQLLILGNYIDQWKMKLNVEKCKCLTIKGTKKFLYKSHRKYEPKILINDKQVANSDSLKYLGVWLDSKFNFVLHNKNKLEKSRRGLIMLIRLLSRKTVVNEKVKMLCYKQIIRPIITYAFPFWFSISAYQIERIRLFERSVLRRILKVGRRNRGSFKQKRNSELYDSIDACMFLYAIKFIVNCYHLKNNLVRFNLYNNVHSEGKRCHSIFDITHLFKNKLIFNDKYICKYYEKRTRSEGNYKLNNYVSKKFVKKVDQLEYEVEDWILT